MDVSGIRFDIYYKHAELEALLKGFAAAYPGLCDLGVTGKSWEGRSIYVVTVTNKATGEASGKPAMYIDGNMHAGEVTGSMVCLYTINYLLTRYGKDEQVTWLLDNRAFYITPRVNPDGAEKYLTTPYMLRSSVRPYPDPAVAEMPGLWPEDIDGDGRILTMRVRDDTKGEWKVSLKDPRVMVPRRPDDRKRPFFRLYQEGLIKEFEGEPFGVNTTPWGLDMNRNFPSNWNAAAKVSGPYPASEPEVKNIVDFILAHPNIGALQAFHTTGGIIFRSPYAYPDNQMDKDDYETMIHLARMGTEATGYPDVSSHGQSTATIVDWAYEHRGIIGFTTELWDAQGRAGISKNRDYSGHRVPDWEQVEADNIKMLRWNDKELAGKGFTSWRSYEHPQLGQVEIGGWEPKFVRQNCPPQFLEQECHKNMLFTFSHCTALPDVKVTQVRTDKVESGVYKISALIENSGYLPTSISNKGMSTGAAKTGRVTMEAPDGVDVIAGKRVTDMGHLDGYRQGQPAGMGGPAAPAKSSVRVQWLVKCETAPQQVAISVDACRGGRHSKAVMLG
ncbi:MAG: M14 family metallopeptidase [Bacillota bacterium]|nr:M14 family metallopeptidase [Bacillota bacterium]